MMMMNNLFLLALDYAQGNIFILFGLDCVSYPCHQAGNECLVMDVVISDFDAFTFIQAMSQ